MKELTASVKPLPATAPRHMAFYRTPGNKTWFCLGPYDTEQEAIAMVLGLTDYEDAHLVSVELPV